MLCDHICCQTGSVKTQSDVGLRHALGVVGQEGGREGNKYPPNTRLISKLFTAHPTNRKGRLRAVISTCERCPKARVSTRFTQAERNLIVKTFSGFSNFSIS